MDLQISYDNSNSKLVIYEKRKSRKYCIDCIDEIKQSNYLLNQCVDTLNNQYVPTSMLRSMQYLFRNKFIKLIYSNIDSYQYSNRIEYRVEGISKLAQSLTVLCSSPRGHKTDVSAALILIMTKRSSALLSSAQLRSVLRFAFQFSNVRIVIELALLDCVTTAKINNFLSITRVMSTIAYYILFVWAQK